MNKSETNSIPTWDVLIDLGFVPEDNDLSEICPGLSYDFGNFKLSASAVTNQWYRSVVLFTGVLVEPRKLREYCFELNRTVASREQCAAFLVYYLDQGKRRPEFQPARSVAWVTDGRQNRHLLPWEVDKAAYNARPQCVVQRDWLRLALRDLAAYLAKVDEAANVDFSFNGAVLMIQCSEKVLPMSARGISWNAQFTISAGNLQRLPKRLAYDAIGISIWKDQLIIGGYRFDGIKVKTP